MRKLGLALLATVMVTSLMACDSRLQESTVESVEEIEEVVEEPTIEADEVVVLGEDAIISPKVWGKINDNAEVALFKITPENEDANKADLSIKFKIDGSFLQQEYAYDSSTNETENLSEEVIPYDVKVLGFDTDRNIAYVRIDNHRPDIPYLDLSGNHDDVYLTSEYCYAENDTLMVLFGPGRELRGDFLEKMKEGILNHEENSHPESLEIYYGTIQKLWDRYYSGDNPFSSVYLDRSKFCLVQVMDENEEIPGFMFWWIGRHPVIELEDIPSEEFTKEEKEKLYGDPDF